MTRFLYLIPSAYFARTRLLKTGILFHAVFEWGAALVLVSMFGTHGIDTIWSAVVAYFAFIALYEIGYLYNDLVSVRFEDSPRKRGPEDATAVWMLLWVAARIAAFLFLSHVIGMTFVADWWLFFVSISIVFGLHNVLRHVSIKCITFFWLSWFRFMAPVIFFIQPDQLMGIAFGAAMLYCGFRLFGYLDSKGLLRMPDRASAEFRVGYFTLPLIAVMATFHIPEAAGFRVLALYFAAAAVSWLVFDRIVRPALAAR